MMYAHDIALVDEANPDSLHSQYLCLLGSGSSSWTQERRVCTSAPNLRGHNHMPLRRESVCRYRLVVDESLALGVLGQHGRGACEHWGLKPGDAEIVSASMGDCSHLAWQQLS